MLTKKELIEALSEYSDDIEIVLLRRDLQDKYMEQGFVVSEIGSASGHVSQNMFILTNYTPKELEELHYRINFHFK